MPTVGKKPTPKVWIRVCMHVFLEVQIGTTDSWQLRWNDDDDDDDDDDDEDDGWRLEVFASPGERSTVSSGSIVPYHHGGRRGRWLLRRCLDAGRPACQGATDWSVGTFEGGIRRQRRKNNKNEEREDLTYSRHVWRGASPDDARRRRACAHPLASVDAWPKLQPPTLSRQRHETTPTFAFPPVNVVQLLIVGYVVVKPPFLRLFPPSRSLSFSPLCCLCSHPLLSRCE